MKIIKDVIPVSATKRPGRFGQKKGFTIHSTANKNSTARNERDYLANPNNKNYASYNFVVDDKEAIECIPWNEVSYHAGNREGNWNTIGIEMCESGDRNKVISNTIDLIIKLHKEHGAPLNLYRHYDWPMVENGYRYRKNCPRILNYSNWQGWVEFKALLKARMEGSGMNDKRVREIVREEIANLESGEEVRSWARDAVDYVKEEKLMEGYEDGTFRPNKPVTRAELAAVVYRISKE